jgi:hypothetical protein
LFVDERIAAVIVAFEVVGSRFTAKIAINALVIDVIFSVDIFGIPICNISHIVASG